MDAHKAANRWVARFMPIFLAGIVGYASWVVTHLICVDYLIKPPNTIRSARPGAAIAILVLYYILFALMVSSLLRILLTLATDPGYTERRREKDTSKQRSRRDKSTDGKDEKSHSARRKKRRASRSGAHDDSELGVVPYDISNHTGKPALDGEAPGLEGFYRKNVFVCEGDGRPIWCSKCQNWKPDRTHHCREVDRCVRKMDHFCPWVGGIVSEQNFKFFLQFVFWTALYCTNILVFMAIFISEVHKSGRNYNAHWIIVLALSALFLFFSLGMTLSSLQLALVNTTSVESLSRHSKVTTLAVYVPNPSPPGTFTPYKTVTYPLPRFQTRQVEVPGATHPRPEEPNNNNPSQPTRTFAILHTLPGVNPWDLGFYGNVKSVLGDHVYDWFLPLRFSPATDHERYGSEFEFGPAVQKLRQDFGIVWDEDRLDERRKRRRRRRKSVRGEEGEEMKEKSRSDETGMGVGAAPDSGRQRDLEAGGA